MSYVCIVCLCVFAFNSTCALLSTKVMFTLMNSRLISHCLTCNVHNSALEYSIIRRYTNAVYYILLLYYAEESYGILYYSYAPR